MPARCLLFLALTGVFAVPGPARSAAGDSARPPTLIVRVRSLDSVLADVKYFLTLAGREEDVKNLDDAIKKTFPKGFEGIDSKRPLGLYGTLDPDGNLQESIPVLLVPIVDEKAFLGLLENLTKQTAKKEDDGVFVLGNEESRVPIYVRFASRYAYVTAREKTALAPKALLAPDKALPRGRSETLSAVFRIDQIPEAFKQIILSYTENKLADVQDRKVAGETATQHAFKVQAAKELAGQFARLIKDGHELTLRLNIDRQANELSAELSLTGKEESKLAATIAAFADTPSLFAGLFSSDSAMKMLIHGALPDSLRKTLESVIDEGIHSGLQKEKDPIKRGQAAKLFDALAPSVKAGEVDAAVNLRGPAANQHYTVVAGIKLKKGEDLEDTVRDLVGNLPEAERAKFKLDVDTAGEVKIHRVDLQKDFDAEARRHFGNNPVYFAIRSNALVVAAGEGGLSALKEALAAQPKTAPPLQIEMSVARLVALMGKEHNREPRRVAQEAFGDSAKNNDKLRITIEGGKALKVRLEMKSSVVKFISLVDKEDNKKK